ncbi:MAG: DUF6314 family protein [Candidatus Paracaedibacteraceae bacterium]|nr:DUF6314 family protein [Candidatus Paracaedibacteraceae bacterium]
MKSTFFDNLVGKWDFNRVISLPKNKIKGRATFTRKAVAHLNYHEEGTYIVNEISYDFFQKRIFELNKNTFTIYKIDESILHVFENIEHHKEYPILMTHAHQCGSDTYSCKITFINEASFSISYLIKGDKKDYEIQTLYTKCIL